MVGQPVRHMAADQQVARGGMDALLGLGACRPGAEGRRPRAPCRIVLALHRQPACCGWVFCDPPLQVSGTAQYVDDIKLPAGSLHAALVLSTRPHARLLRVDTAAAAAMPGVHGVYLGARCGGGAR